MIRETFSFGDIFDLENILYQPEFQVSYNSVINACAQKGRVSRAVA